MHLGVIDFIKSEVGKLHSFKSVYDFEGKSFVKVIGQKVTTPNPLDWSSIIDDDDEYDDDDDDYERNINIRHTLDNIITVHKEDLLYVYFLRSENKWM